MFLATYVSPFVLYEVFIQENGLNAGKALGKPFVELRESASTRTSTNSLLSTINLCTICAFECA